MDKKEFNRAINEIIDMSDTFDKSNDRLGDLFGADAIAENVFLTHFYEMRYVAIKHVSTIVDDNDEWVLWYIDNVISSKDKSLDVSIKSESYQCSSIDDLWEIIQKRK